VSLQKNSAGQLPRFSKESPTYLSDTVGGGLVTSHGAARCLLIRVFGLPGSAPRGFFVIADQLRFGEQHLAKRSEHLQQQVELSQALATRAYGAEKEFELYPSATVGNRHHASAPLVLTTTTGFDFREYVGRLAR